MLRLLHRTPAPQARSVERDIIPLAMDDGSTIDIRRVRDPRARRLKISVDERGARLTLPPRASLHAGEKFLNEHRDWVAMQLARFDLANVVSPLQQGVTSSLPLRGEVLPLHWSEGRYTRLQEAADGLHFQVSARTGTDTLKRTLRQFYEAQARADVGRWLPKYLSGLPRPPARLRLKAMSSLWGSLSPDDSVTLDLSLVLGSPEAFEYVLVHELCHLIRPDHSRAFWREVEARFPRWREQREYFHAEGRRLKATLRVLID